MSEWMIGFSGPTFRCTQALRQTGKEPKGSTTAPEWDIIIIYPRKQMIPCVMYFMATLQSCTQFLNLHFMSVLISLGKKYDIICQVSVIKEHWDKVYFRTVQNPRERLK